MGRYCKVCGRQQANENFGGRGLRSIICKKCFKLPIEQRMTALWTEEIYGFLHQSNISLRNIDRLKELESKGIDNLSDLAATVRQIAEIHPRKKKRWNSLRLRKRQLFLKAMDLGLLEDFEEDGALHYFGEELIIDGVWIESTLGYEGHELEELFANPKCSVVPSEAADDPVFDE